MEGRLNEKKKFRSMSDVLINKFLSWSTTAKKNTNEEKKEKYSSAFISEKKHDHQNCYQGLVLNESYLVKKIYKLDEKFVNYIVGKNIETVDDCFVCLMELEDKDLCCSLVLSLLKSDYFPTIDFLLFNPNANDVEFKLDEIPSPLDFFIYKNKILYLLVEKYPQLAGFDRRILRAALRWMWKDEVLFPAMAAAHKSNFFSKRMMNDCFCYLIENNFSSTTEKFFALYQNCLFEEYDNIESPLHTAVRSENYFWIEILVDNGFDVFARDNHNQTPLEISLSKGNEDMQSLMFASQNFNIDDLDFRIVYKYQSLQQKILYVFKKIYAGLLAAQSGFICCKTNLLNDLENIPSLKNRIKKIKESSEVKGSRSAEALRQTCAALQVYYPAKGFAAEEWKKRIVFSKVYVEGFRRSFFIKQSNLTQGDSIHRYKTLKLAIQNNNLWVRPKGNPRSDERGEKTACALRLDSM